MLLERVALLVGYIDTARSVRCIMPFRDKQQSFASITCRHINVHIVFHSKVKSVGVICSKFHVVSCNGADVLRVIPCAATSAESVRSDEGALKDDVIQIPAWP